MYQHGPLCLGTGDSPKKTNTSEDCLFLDVYAPTNATVKSNLPIFLFIQGGGFNYNANPPHEESGYQVRAIFDNAGFAQPGMDVKVAGVVVGAIESVEVTEDFKAAVVLDITEPGYQDFRRDATCIVRPQSLIGEKFVECDPGTANSPELAKIDDGDGKGQHLLPLARTSSPVDLDLINDTISEETSE